MEQAPARSLATSGLGWVGSGWVWGNGQYTRLATATQHMTATQSLVRHKG